MKSLSMLLLAILTSFFVFSQHDESRDYRKIKDEISEKVFGTPDPIFSLNKLPDQYKNESAVILAQKHTIESDSKAKIGGAKFMFVEIFRRKVFINDEVALKEFSELNFQKLQSKFVGSGMNVKHYTFINIHLIKSNGTTKTIDVDESAVTVESSKSDKKDKIAIPDLGVGDILDYYIASYDKDESTGMTDLSYVFGDDYPILTYALSLQFDTRISVLYQSINGAPDFKIQPNADGGGNILTTQLTNIPKYKGMIWSSVYRQIPLIRLKYMQGTIRLEGVPDITAGHVVKAGPQFADIMARSLAMLVASRCENDGSMTIQFSHDRKLGRKAWENYKSKHPKADNPDSLAVFVYNYLTWNYFFSSFNLKTQYDLAYFPIDLSKQIDRISEFAYFMGNEFDTDIDLLVAFKKDGYAPENIMDVGDFSLLVKPHGGKPKFFSFEDNLGYVSGVPSDLEGQHAMVFAFDVGHKQVSVERKNSGMITLPITHHTDNSESEVIIAKIDDKDPQVVDVARTLTSQGHLKRDEQKALTIYEEMALAAGKSVEEDDDLETINKNRSKFDRAPEDELQTLLAKARTNHMQDFENEVERNYDTKAKQVSNCKILNIGTSTVTPFEFEENFTMDGWIKKAGNNYLLDIGKLITSPLEIKADQHERTKDVYMPFARTFEYRIEFQVPDGYIAEGIDKLNIAVENETGGFTSKASLDGRKIVVDINKHYNNSFEPASKWDLLLSFLDKAVDFSQQKILLKKN